MEIGKTVTVECQVQANPAHTSVQWKRVINGVTSDLDVSNGNKYIGATVNTPSLTIQATTDSDEGYYICTATNAVGTGSSSQSYVDVTGSKLKFNQKGCILMSVSSKKKFTQKILLLRKIDINWYTVQPVLTRTYLVPVLAFVNLEIVGLICKFLILKLIFEMDIHELIIEKYGMYYSFIHILLFYKASDYYYLCDTYLYKKTTRIDFLTIFANR